MIRRSAIVRRGAVARPSAVTCRGAFARRGAVALTSLWLAMLAGCTEAPVTVPLRALQSSGPTSFLCLGDPAAPESMARRLSDCTTTRTGGLDDYQVPHLYALVTHALSGEVAVVDLTTQSDAVLDHDPIAPGSNFLPVGALPVDIVSTPGGAASFVASSETNFEGIYGLPSSMLRGGTPRLTSWPSCALPAAPGEMLLVVDPVDAQGAARPSCDAAYGASEEDSECEGTPHCHGDLAADAERAGKPGRYKLLVTLPSEGGIAVVDAQKILDQEAGVRAPCAIERWLPLKVELPPASVASPAPSQTACVPEPTPISAVGRAFSPQPAGMAQMDSQLFVADQAAPVIHRINLPTPCEPQELPPLLATSVDEPERMVTTSKLAVSPLTLDLKRYLYAIDRLDGSLMVYDVSDGASQLTPLQRPAPAYNPFQPADRIRFGAPPRDIVIVQHQNDAVRDASGATLSGSTLPLRCDPRPNSSEPGTVYQTSSTFDSGAGPLKLRGVFAFAVLESGDIVAIDVDDYDAACRGPQSEHLSLGCSNPSATTLDSSGEYTCNVVAPHQPRAAGYLVHSEGIAANQPGLSAFPVLFDADGSIIQLDEKVAETTQPRMRATVATSAPPRFELPIGARIEDLDPTSGLLSAGATTDYSEHTLAMNLEDPRAHILDQGWTVTYEGPLPGFQDRFAQLVSRDGGGFELRDEIGQFCTRGVSSMRAVEDEQAADPTTIGQASRLADYVQITSETPVPTDPYWNGPIACSFNLCQEQFGTLEAPRTARDLRIEEAYSDSLELVSRNGERSEDTKLDCCFPGVVQYRVRTGAQWTVVGDAVGFLQRGRAAESGVCRPSCDPNSARLTGRAHETPPAKAVEDDAPGSFSNAFFRFAIQSGSSRRDMQFRFTTQGSFRPLFISVVTDNSDVQPAAVNYLAPTGELVVSDGSLEGITLINLNSLAVTRQYN